MADQERSSREYRLREHEEAIERYRREDAIRRRDAERERLTREARARSERIAASEAKHGDPRLRVRQSAAARPATCPAAVRVLDGFLSSGGRRADAAVADAAETLARAVGLELPDRNQRADRERIRRRAFDRNGRLIGE
ncbi:MAG TPA: hypothetical protein PLR32_00075 [candidate division Zixibacteria bacterium]|nr:hypothetical protein [candidate division Zixibacteria bacterium]